MVFHTCLTSETLPERSSFPVFDCFHFCLMEMRYSRMMEVREEGAERRKRGREVEMGGREMEGGRLGGGEHDKDTETQMRSFVPCEYMQLFPSSISDLVGNRK